LLFRKGDQPVSNIPNSAMPHAWVHEDEEDEEEVGGWTLGSIALAGGAAALLYYVLFGRR
jgi:hypothetical protein